MKKMTMMMGAALLAGGVLAGCSDTEPETKEEKPAEETVNENETTEEAQTEETMNEAEADLEQATEEVKEESKQAAEETKENAEALGTEVKEEINQEQGEEATGIFNGVADPHTVEIEVDGQPAAFQVDPESEIMKKFNEMQGGEEITFVYQTEGESKTIVELKE
ncbi:outer membrane murein-binding lipoprotein Lpp [Bacillus ectoiniformans]|uniref:hypothetical protein n=1 Tax=Bacillus ectoiniformans TaxID=1494429 RepID=UPI00195A5F60|nr:hypothetical protein [Bacillus ectoiniformans]MBM7649171.1 outer membrane murein-binding lipoprotein Lpp [Bacillus ectoiniformans]